ncbi:importin-7-like [Hydractinia symbiolongicarpus]|uniref:importin-7-like n=1 Tax=Hydractinia symbiolongicarpus TaxID=13093 RepID=UPI002550DD61|nr:importin-7-like [Hydractinia symbiolongicarpus]
MDPQLITSIFQHTLEPSPEARAEAEARLTQLSTSPGFLPALIQLVMSEDIQIAIRQAAVIYLKNMISRYWRELEGEAGAQNFTIPENDKLFIRQHIVESIISASELIRVQLTVSIHEILSCDFPEKWPDICVKINGYLTSDNKSTWLGSMLVLYQIVKKYEFKRKEDRGPIEDVMNVFLPILQNRCSSLVKDNSAESFLLITKVFKIFRALIQLNLPLRVINQDNFPQWMGLFKAVLEKPVPEESLQWEEDDRPQLSWWKAKKWAVTVLFKVFERYGCPGSEEKEYNQFADFYDKHYSEQVTGIMLKILDQYRQKNYIAPRVLQQALNYLSQGVYNARSWKIVKPHFLEIFKEIIFPLMCHSEEDESLWLDDPQEYIRIKYDIFEDFLYFSPNAAAKSYLKEAVKKRKNILQPVVEHTMTIFNMDATQRDPKHKDGALHVIGSLAETLSKKKQYKNHMEAVLTSHVLPEFLSQHGFLRARACWVTQQFAIITFKDANVLKQTLHCVLNCLGDKELPVQVEAGIAIRHIVEEQDEQGASEMIRPHVKELVQQILRVLRESENDELTGTISKLVQNFTDEVTSISLELVSTLTETFHSLVESEEDYDNKSVTAMGILETIEIIVGEVDSSPQIMAQLEQLVSRLIKSVLEKELMEYYEEVFSLINECTTIQISPLMWNMLFLLYETFQEDTADYFTEMMPCLHNYVTVDPKAFLAEQRFCEVIVKMCKTMLMDYTGENAQSQAAKLLEVVALQYRGEIDNWLPIFVSLCLERLSMEVKTSELRVMLIQVIVACIINHPIVVLTHLEKMQSPSTPQGVTARFLSQWLNDTDCFLGIHDRKVFVFGICALVSLPAETRPDAVNMFAAQFLPALLIIFEGLKTVYEKMEKEVIEEDTKPEEEELEDSDDEYDEEGTQYLESLQKKQSRLHDFIDDDDWGSELEIFTTPIDDNPYVDEYITFKEAFEALQHNDAHMFAMMTQTLTEEQKHAVQSVINNGIRNQQKLASRKIEEQGGYTFQAPTVPNNFSFGGSLS